VTPLDAIAAVCRHAESLGCTTYPQRDGRFMRVDFVHNNEMIACIQPYQTDGAMFDVYQVGVKRNTLLHDSLAEIPDDVRALISPPASNFYTYAYGDRHFAQAQIVQSVGTYMKRAELK
jgi:hypothetical protein